MENQTEGTTRKDFLKGTAGLAAGAAVVASFGFNRLASAQADPSEMITQTAEMGINPEKADEAVAMLAELVKAVEANEPGVLAYICHRKKEDPNTIVFFEIYKDAAALTAHGQTEHLSKLRAAFGSMLMPPVTITVLDRVEGFSR